MNWVKRGIVLMLFVGMIATCAGCRGEKTPGNETGTKESVPTTTSSPFKQDLQIGGSTFTLDGHTFQMGKSPKELLDFLGEPNKITSFGCDVADGVENFYYYDDADVVTFTPTGTSDEIIIYVYFLTDRFSFDGIKVGDTVETLNQKIPSEQYDYFAVRDIGMGLMGGPCHIYDSDSNDSAEWRVFFSEEAEQSVREDKIVPEGTEIAFICVYYCWF